MWYQLLDRRRVSWIVLSGSCCFSGVAIQANEPDSNSDANQLVAKALDAEAKGELLKREQLLSEAAAVSTELPSLNWYRGKICNDNGTWESIDECVDSATKHEALNDYERLRASKPNTVNAHWEMAQWCAQHKMAPQCRAHLMSIISADPDHRAARNVLGYRLVGTEWVGPERLADLAEQAETATQSQGKYGAKIQQLLAAMLGTNNSKLQAQASEELAAITDPLAIPTLEMAANSSDQAAKIVINWLGNCDSVNASQSLARFATLHPTASVRELATQQLRDKPLFDYVPQVLQSLSGPIQAALVPAFDRRGNFIGYNQAFAKEGMNENRVLLVDRTLTQRGRLELRGRDDLSRLFREIAQSEIALEANSRAVDALQENSEIALRNKRIVALISEVADQEFPNAPQDVWKWWDSYNESNYQAYKPARYRRDSQSREVPQFRSSESHECFVAGTLISTHRGLRPIEKISVGDLALSRNSQTGELCWKPVINCTTRPPEPIISMQVDDDTLQCTRGHLLWVSGKGWTKASQIEPGDILHTATEPAVVLTIKGSNVAPTFNLEIAENHTYFVGKSRVLSHDVTPRGSSRDLVPGLQNLVQAE